MRPAKVPLKAWRNATFSEERQFTVERLTFDFTSYTDALLEVRQYGAEPGDAVISIGKVASNIEGVRFIDPSDGILRFQIDKATLKTAYEALIGSNPAGSAIILVYDLILTGPDGALEPWMEGTFTLNPGVSING